MLAASMGLKLFDYLGGGGGGIFLTLTGFCREMNMFFFLAFSCKIQCKLY